MTGSWLALLAAVMGSGALTALITHWYTRKKTGAEAADITVKAALALEQVAHQRYESTAQALAAAEKLLSYVQKQLRIYHDHIVDLHEILDEAGIDYPPFSLEGEMSYGVPDEQSVQPA